MELYDIQRWAARLTVTLTSEAPANAIQVRTRERLKQGEWNHVVMSYDGSGKAEGLVIYANGKRLAVDVVRNALAGPIATDAALTLGGKALGPPYAGQIDDLRLYNRVLTPGEVEDLAIALPAARDPVGQQRQAVEGAGGLPARVLPHLCRAADVAGAAKRARRGAEREGSGREDDSRPPWSWGS